MKTQLLLLYLLIFIMAWVGGREYYLQKKINQLNNRIWEKDQFIKSIQGEIPGQKIRGSYVFKCERITFVLDDLTCIYPENWTPIPKVEDKK